MSLFDQAARSLSSAELSTSPTTRWRCTSRIPLICSVGLLGSARGDDIAEAGGETFAAPDREAWRCQRGAAVLREPRRKAK